MPCFIYCITSSNGKNYVGSAKDVDRRINQHRWGRSDRARTAIHAAIKKYGWDTFKVEVLEETCMLLRSERENFWIAEKNSLSPSGYNLVLADYTYLTQEQIKRRSDGRIKYNASPEGKKANSERAIRMWNIPGVREKFSASIKSAWSRKDVRDRMITSQTQRWENSPELKQKYRESIKERLHNPEVRGRVNESIRKLWKDPEKREKQIRSMVEGRIIKADRISESTKLILDYLDSVDIPEINEAWISIRGRFEKRMK
jgi:group I intron endonuclease